jgi:hypothetical protein
MQTIVNAENEVAKGNLWRAKEILQGSIPNAGYDCDLFEKLGIVLLIMGDLPEAGRFLFLAGNRKPEYDEAIGIFLKKHNKNWRVLLHAFPRVARLSSLAEYPVCVGSELANCGFPAVIRNDANPGSSDSESLSSDLVGWLIIGSLLFVMFLGTIKVIEMVRWVF